MEWEHIQEHYTLQAAAAEQQARHARRTLMLISAANYCQMIVSLHITTMQHADPVFFLFTTEIEVNMSYYVHQNMIRNQRKAAEREAAIHAIERSVARSLLSFAKLHILHKKDMAIILHYVSQKLRR